MSVTFWKVLYIGLGQRPLRQCKSGMDLLASYVLSLLRVHHVVRVADWAAHVGDVGALVLGLDVPFCTRFLPLREELDIALSFFRARREAGLSIYTHFVLIVLFG